MVVDRSTTGLDNYMIQVFLFLLLLSKDFLAIEKTKGKHEALAFGVGGWEELCASWHIGYLF